MSLCFRWMSEVAVKMWIPGPFAFSTAGMARSTSCSRGRASERTIGFTTAAATRRTDSKSPSEEAKRPGIHIFIATSDIHLQHKLMMSRKDVVDAAAWAIGFAKKRLDYVEFSAEDASRSDRDYLVSVFTEVIKAGAVTINVPDTTGY